MYYISLILIFVVSLHSATARPAFGVYPSGRFHDQESTVEERFIDWYPYSPGAVYNAIQTATKHHRQLLLTLQPMTNPLLGTDLLHDVALGKYDDVIRQSVAKSVSVGIQLLFGGGTKWKFARIVTPGLADLQASTSPPTDMSFY